VPPCRQSAVRLPGSGECARYLRQLSPTAFSCRLYPKGGCQVLLLDAYLPRDGALLGGHRLDMNGIKLLNGQLGMDNKKLS
jgi:hypothetical protein